MFKPVQEFNWLEEHCQLKDKIFHISKHGQFLKAKINLSNYFYISLKSLLFQLSIFKLLVYCLIIFLLQDILVSFELVKVGGQFYYGGIFTLFACLARMNINTRLMLDASFEVENGSKPVFLLTKDCVKIFYRNPYVFNCLVHKN